MTTPPWWYRNELIVVPAIALGFTILWLSFIWVFVELPARKKARRELLKQKMRRVEPLTPDEVIVLNAMKSRLGGITYVEALQCGVIGCRMVAFYSLCDRGVLLLDDSTKPARFGHYTIEIRGGPRAFETSSR